MALENKQNKEKKIYLFNALGGLTPDNVSEVYAKEYAKWRVLNSSQVTINGDDVSSCSSLLKEMLMLPDENGNPNIEECTVNDKNKSGFYRDEQLFIDQELAHYKPILEKSKGSIINEDAHLKIKAYIKYLEQRENHLKGNAKCEQETPKTFDELFYNIELVQPSIDILKEIEPPLIDTDYNYIGRLKGIICVWIDELQRQGIVKHYSDRKIFASLIPQKIKRFSIDESMFGKYHNKAEESYRTDIKTKVSKIKLSQNSQ